jgi:ribose transport system ATP-binding protein
MNAMMLELHDISKSFFGVYALRGVTLNIAKGRILGLIGQNGAGKSTLMNIMGGVVQPDNGTMQLNGQRYAPRNPADASHARIAFIHQELNLFTNLSIAENIFIEDFPKKHVGLFSFIDRKTMQQRTRDLLHQVNVALSPETLVERLSPGERQLVEIARALHIDAEVLIFDEPTTSLTARETTRLFELIQRLREAGKTIIYISHNLADVVALSDDIAVLRDGELAGAGLKSEFDIYRMIALMVGRSIEQFYPPRTASPTAKAVLQARGLTEAGIIRNINLTLHEGEVLGLFGLMGSGRTELARILFGLEGFTSGEIVIRGKTLGRTSARTSIRQQVAFITENRREEGLLMNLPVSDNITLTALPAFAATPLQVIDAPQLLAAANQMASAMQIKTGAMERQIVKSLSGGNQQKVVIARWLMSKPSVFILDEPTRGVDVAAKYEIYTIINNLVAQGAAVLFISSELDELMNMCDRILVMAQGEIVGEFAHADFDKERILHAAFREEGNQA